MDSIPKARPVLPAAGIPSLICLVLVIIGGPSSASAHPGGQEVEIRLKIQPGAGTRMDEPWVVELRKSSGVLVGISVAMTGATVHFKHLSPEIYVACLEAGSGLEHCQSIDMILPAGRKNQRFTMNLTAPDPMLNRPDLHCVKLSHLEVPLKARQEFIQGEKAGLEGNDQQMVSHLERAIQIHPSYVAALNNLGAHYHRVGNNELSIQYLKRAVQLDPDFAAGWVNLAGALLATYRWEEARMTALRGVMLRPSDALTNSQLALSYYFLKCYPEAEPYFKRVLELDPAFANSPSLYLAQISIAEGRMAAAQDYIRAFLKLHPNSPNAPFWAQTLHALASGTIIMAPATVAAQRQQ